MILQKKYTSPFVSDIDGDGSSTYVATSVIWWWLNLGCRGGFWNFVVPAFKKENP